MPASEIDDIFSGVASSSKAAVAVEAKQTKKEKLSGKKRKSELVESSEPELDKKSKAVSNFSSSSLISGKTEMDKKQQKKKKEKLAETIFDPSKIIESKMEAKKKLKTLSSSKTKLTEDEEDFMDTRGNNRRKTEDGFLIYKADELKIDEDSGGTPLCPFDCDCCH